MKRAKRVIRRATLAGLCLCLLVLTGALAAQTPVAGSLTHEEAIARARESVRAAYGLDEGLLLKNFNETLELNPHATSEVSITYTPKHRADVLGAYTVTLSAQGDTARWTKDGADQALTASGAWESPAWGAAQLARLADLDAAYAQRLIEMVIEKGPLRDWSLQDRAALEAPLREAGYPVNRVYHSVPGPMDIPQAEAARLAEAAIEAAFGVAARDLSGYVAYTRFLYLPPMDSYIWRIDYSASNSGFAVELDGATGEVTLCRLMPGKETSVQAAAAAATAAPQMPGVGELSRAEAIAVAEECLAKETGFDARTLSVFPVTAWYEAGEVPVWHVAFEPEEPKVQELLGTYMLTVSAQTAQVIAFTGGVDGVS